MSVTPTVGEHSSTPRPPKYAFGKNNCVSASAVASTICMIEILTFFHALVSVVMPVFKLFQCYSTKYQNMCLLLLFFGKQLNSSKKRLKFLDVFHHLGFCLCCKAVHSDQGFEKIFSTYCIFASYFSLEHDGLPVFSATGFGGVLYTRCLGNVFLLCASRVTYLGMSV